MNCCHSNSNPLLVVLLLTSGCGCTQYSSTLHYDGISMAGGNKVGSVQCWEGGEIPLFFRAPARSKVTYSTETISEVDVKVLSVSSISGSFGSINYRLDDWSSIELRDGKFRQLTLGPGWAVSPRPDGEFVLLPSNERTIRKVFGKPTSVEWNKVRPVWH